MDDQQDNRVLSIVNERRDIRDPVASISTKLSITRRATISSLLRLHESGRIEAWYSTTDYDDLGQPPGKISFFSVNSVSS
jgi:hypothetical protein